MSQGKHSVWEWAQPVQRSFQRWEGGGLEQNIILGLWDIIAAYFLWCQCCKGRGKKLHKICLLVCPPHSWRGIWECWRCNFFFTFCCFQIIGVALLFLILLLCLAYTVHRMLLVRVCMERKDNFGGNKSPFPRIFFLPETSLSNKAPVLAGYSCQSFNFLCISVTEREKITACV